MKDDTKELMDSLLADWFRWARGYQIVAGHGKSAMFTGVRSSRQWDSEDEVVGGELHNSQMKAVDFHINELCDVYRSALGINARNLVTGRSVWSSARLPQDIEERAVILVDARNGLLVRLRDAGIL